MFPEYIHPGYTQLFHCIADLLPLVGYNVAFILVITSSCICAFVLVSESINVQKDKLLRVSIRNPTYHIRVSVSVTKYVNVAGPVVDIFSLCSCRVTIVFLGAQCVKTELVPRSVT